MYSLLRKSKKLGLSIDLQLELFDSLVMPILLYGTQVWGYGNNEMLERLHLKFCRMLLCVNNSTARCMIYGEFGISSLQTLIDYRILTYWSILIHSDEHTLNRRLYLLTLNLAKQKVINSEWICSVQQTLNNCSLYQCWLTQNIHVTNTNIFKTVINKILNNNYESDWKDSVHNNQKYYNYRMFKRSLCFEEYLVKLPVALRAAVTKYRLFNHNLPIEKGRYENIVRHDRKCVHL